MSETLRLPFGFSPEPWSITEAGLAAGCRGRHGALFTLGNGRICLRGSHDEDERSPDQAALDGVPVEVPNAKCVTLSVAGERFDLAAGVVLNYRRRLDFRTGVLERSLEWMAPSGKRVAIRSRRLASFDLKQLFAVEYEVTPLNFSGPLWLLSTVDCEAGEQEGSFTGAAQCGSGLTVVSAIDSEVAGAGRATYQEAHKAGQAFAIDALQSRPVRLAKFGVYLASRDSGADELMVYARRMLAEARRAGFEALHAQQQAFLAGYWTEAGAGIGGDTRQRQGARLNQFRLLQAIDEEVRSLA